MQPIDVTWVYTAATRGLLGRRKSKEVRSPGRLVEISVTGASIEGPASPSLRPGATAEIHLRNSHSVVRIRRVGAGTDPEVYRFGVEYVQLDEQMKEQIYDLLGRGRPSEDAWFRAR